MRQILLIFLLCLAVKYGAGLGAAQSRIRESIPLGNIFLDEKLCGRRLNTLRLSMGIAEASARRSNTIQDLVIMSETKVANAKKSQTVDFFELYDEKTHSQADARMRVRAYYFPFFKGDPVVGKGKAEKLNVGWVDIPKKPQLNSPRLAITDGMNGCATIVMSLKNDRKKLRVYHLQSPGARNGDQWNGYIRKIKEFHPAVDQVINSFSWEDYGVDEEIMQAITTVKTKPPLYEAVVLLHYRPDKQKWYYASQLNFYDQIYFDKNKKERHVLTEDKYFDGIVYKTLYANLENSIKPAPYYCLENTRKSGAKN